jgi:nucleoside-diphosphate-sugar epimerase
MAAPRIERKEKRDMYLITGGAGFIGASLAEALVASGERVRIFDNFSTGLRANLEGFADKIEVAEGRELRIAPGGTALGAALGRRPAQQ